MQWVEKMNQADANFFSNLAKQQSPEILWIGCADSRVPANQIVGLLPGELFVHRNVANIVSHSDLNCLSVLQFAVEVLKIRHIIVCGHYHCGGVEAALHQKRLGLVENWIAHISDVIEKHAGILGAIEKTSKKEDALCELNVIEQVDHVCSSSVVRDAWKRGAPLSVHGWIYDVGDGLLRDLDLCVNALEEQSSLHKDSVQKVRAKYCV